MRHIPPRLLEWTVKAGDKLKDVLATLEAKDEYWFVTVVSTDGTLKTVVKEEAFWRFVQTQILTEEYRDNRQR